MAENKHILLITTGGTIAGHSGEADREVLLSGASMQELAAKLMPVSLLQDGLAITVKELYNLDSTEIGPEHWEALVRLIDEYKEQCQGILITHGTNTLAYTATALAFAFPDIPIPVILSGAQYPIGHPNTDGTSNLRAALLACVHSSPVLAGVHVVFGESLLPGAQVSKRSATALDAFNWPDRLVVGRFRQSWEIDQEIWTRYKSSQDWPAQLQAPHAFSTAGILQLRAFPGMSLSGMVSLAHAAELKALILCGLGSGDLAAYHMPALQQLASLKVPVIMHSQVPFAAATMRQNLPGRLLLEAGLAIPAGSMSLESTLIKLSILLAQGLAYDTIPGLMARNFCGEGSIVKG